jgi:hypothetical protein
MNSHATSTSPGSHTTGAPSAPGALRRPLEFEPLREITAEDLERAKARAHELRAQALAQMITAAVAWLRNAGRRLALPLKHAGGRADPCHEC